MRGRRLFYSSLSNGKGWPAYLENQPSKSFLLTCAWTPLSSANFIELFQVGYIYLHSYPLCIWLPEIWGHILSVSLLFPMLKIMLDKWKYQLQLTFQIRKWLPIIATIYQCRELKNAICSCNLSCFSEALVIQAFVSYNITGNLMAIKFSTRCLPW